MDSESGQSSMGPQIAQINGKKRKYDPEMMGEEADPHASADGEANLRPEMAVEMEVSGRDSVLLEAFSLVCQQGISREQAKEALRATGQEYSHAGDSKLAVDWADSALLYLAMNQSGVIEDFTGQDQLDETAQEKALDDAMVASLADAEERKARPIEDLENEDLCLRFRASQILPELKGLCEGNDIFEGNLRGPLIKALELEKRSKQWYRLPGTASYFDELVKQCTLEIEGVFSRPADAPCQAEEGGCSLEGSKPKKGVRKTAKSAKGKGKELNAQSTLSLEEQREQAKERVAAFLTRKVQELEAALYAMPDEPGQVPLLFLSGEAEEDPDCLVVERRARGC